MNVAFCMLEYKVLMVLLLFVFVLKKIDIAQRGGESYQHRDDRDKSTCSVSDVLFEHGLFCFTANLYVSDELVNEF